jgi:hypothetical protein
VRAAPVTWRDRALCKDRPDLDWDNEPTIETRQVCLGCPVLFDCAAEGLRLRECIGTWAATSWQDRAAIRRGRKSMADVWREHETLRKV